MEKNNIGKRAEQLQFLRFLAFLLVFQHHASMWDFKIGNFKFPGPAGAAFAVSFFIILSGLVTGYSFNGKEQPLSFKEIFKEIGKKIKKVYPLYIITTFVAIMYSDIPISISYHKWSELVEQFEQLLKNIFLIQSWFDSKYFSFNGVGWFLSTIMFLYMFNIPSKYILNKIGKNKYKYIVSFILLIIILSLDIMYLYYIKDFNTGYLGYIFPPARLGEYLCGIILGYILSSIKINKNKFIFVIFTILEITILIVDFKSLYLLYPKWTNNIVCRLLPIFLTLSIFTLERGYISKLFKNKYLVKLGNLSFGCYLIHLPIITLYYRTCKTGSVTTIGDIFSINFCLILTLLLSYYYNKHKSYR